MNGAALSVFFRPASSPEQRVPGGSQSLYTAASVLVLSGWFLFG